MNGDTSQFAYRLMLGAVLVYVLWVLAGNLIGFGTLIVRTNQDNRAQIARQHPKSSAADLQSQLQEAKLVPANSGIVSVAALV